MTSKYDTREGWKLVDQKTGEEIKVGDTRQTSKDEEVVVTYLQPPHKSSSQGKVNVKFVGQEWTSQFYASVVGGRYEYEGDAS